MTYLILIRGASGVGKSTIAENIAKKLPGKVAFLSYDRFFFNILVNHKKMQRKYKMQVIYELIEMSIKKFLSEDFNVVVEGMYLDKIDNKLVAERICIIGKRYRVKTYIIDLLANIETILHRATNIRKADYDLIPKASEDLRRSYNEFMSNTFSKSIKINTEKKSTEQVVSEILSIVRRK